MAADDTQAAFAEAAAADGIVLEAGTFDWLCERGHSASSGWRWTGATRSWPPR